MASEQNSGDSWAQRMLQMIQQQAEEDGVAIGDVVELATMLGQHADGLMDGE